MKCKVGQLRELVSMAHLCGAGTQLGQPLYYLSHEFKTIMRVPGISSGQPCIFTPDGFRPYTMSCESMGNGMTKFMCEFIEK